MQFLIDIGLSLIYLAIFLLLCVWVWRFWMMYVHTKHLSSLDWIMLEIKLPREITKTPLAMEAILPVFLQNSGVSTKYARNFEGKLPAFASLEIASIEGVIHFYVRIQRKFKPIVESAFYAHYPGIEIVAAEDYTKLIRYHHLSKNINLWGFCLRPSKTWVPIDPTTGEEYKDIKMKADFWPIKTYVDFGLDKEKEEEYKVDPIVSLLELMGSLGKGEHMWYQVLLQDESVYDGKKFSKLYVNDKTHEHYSLTDMIKEYKSKLRTSHYIKKGDIVYEEYGEPKKKKVGKDSDGNDIFEKTTYTFPDPKMVIKAVSKKETDLTGDEKDEIEILNNKISKPIAHSVVRLVYITKKEVFNGSIIPATLTFGKFFSGKNSFIPVSSSDPYDYPWQKRGDRRTFWRAEEVFEAYVEREGFFPHIKSRDVLDEFEDIFFFPYSMKTRKMFRMIWEGIFHPFEHPQPSEVFAANLEEIATLWHLPGAVAGVPTLPRIDSTKGVAPPNLPL